MWTIGKCWVNDKQKEKQIYYQNYGIDTLQFKISPYI